MNERFDFIVIGSGPGGQKAAIGAAKAGRSVALIEQDRFLGGACVHYGTIPSKTLREVAIRVRPAWNAESEEARQLESTSISNMLGSVEEVVSCYASTVKGQMERNGVKTFHGRASFVGVKQIEVRHRNGESEVLDAEFVILATGSRPRQVDGISVDHEHVLDGDSVLKLAYLPVSLVVLGGGVIACEYASIFARLGVGVTIVDRGERPLGFMDAELTECFLDEFQAAGGRYLGGRSISSMGFNGISKVQIEFEDDESVSAEKVLVALGRSGCFESLNLADCGLEPNNRGALDVDENGATSVPGIYAVGDIAGPPALATSAMEQGRRAIRHALDLPVGRFGEWIPTGIYTIPELASVGPSEVELCEAGAEIAVGRARFEELARGQIMGLRRGLLKIIADVEDRRILGVCVAGAGAAELIHVGQMAIIAGASIDDLIENVFNFPTLTESYRVAALDCANQIDALKGDVGGR